jgi:phage tail sheath protein FI
MPEYLAPGVYVEETSFRAKSIEGVSTSTTAFVGPTRRGPIPPRPGTTTETPELVTSYADFERIYGGIGKVHGGENFLAHGVRAYFNEGGARLYVARVFTAAEGSDGRARSRVIASTGDGAGKRNAQFVARFPGLSGNGRITLRKIYQPATADTMKNAPEGTLLRTGGDAPAEPARVRGAGGGPFTLRNDETLVLVTGEGDAAKTVTVTFTGTGASLTAPKVPANPQGLSAEDRTLRITVNGTVVPVVIPDESMTAEQLAAFLNARLLPSGVGVTAPDGKLVFTTVRQGTGASLAVDKNTKFGLTAEAKTIKGEGSVPDLSSVSVTDLDRALQAFGLRAGTREGGLDIRTAATGAEQALRVGAGTGNVGLGLTETPQADPPARGRKGPAQAWWALKSGRWADAANKPLDPGRSDQMEGGADFVTLFVETEDGDGARSAYEGLALGEDHPRFLAGALPEVPSRRSDYLEQAFAYVHAPGVGPLQLHDALFGGAEVAVLALDGGNDGLPPIADAYREALNTLKPLEDISILAAPGHTAYKDAWQGIQLELISFAERPRAYQIAVLDTPPQQEVSGAREARSRVDSKYAALYYPWVTVSNPSWRPGRDDLRREIDLPPSGFVAGIYARNDVQRGVHKAPANEVVRGALRFETDVNFDEQGVLNPIGVNCLRFFPGRGNRVWGARTVSSDPEWKYVNVRRYFNYVERSIDVGTQWAVFEPNGEALWANVRQTIASFLYNEWRNGALLGTDPKQAYFVRCDRSTMTQNDLDNGRLVCLVGVAVIKPAEFVIFRIGQKTADARE